MGWEQVAVLIVSIIGTIVTVVTGLIVWLRNDIKRLEDKMDEGFKSVDDRLRKVENEQARVAGLLERLGLSGKLAQVE